MKRKISFLFCSCLFIFLMILNTNKNSVSFNNSPQKREEITKIFLKVNNNLENYLSLTVNEVKNQFSKLDFKVNRENNSFFESLENKIEQAIRIDLLIEKSLLNKVEISYLIKTILQRDENRVLRL